MGYRFTVISCSTDTGILPLCQVFCGPGGNPPRRLSGGKFPASLQRLIREAGVARRNSPGRRGRDENLSAIHKDFWYALPVGLDLKFIAAVPVFLS